MTDKSLSDAASVISKAKGSAKAGVATKQAPGVLKRSSSYFIDPTLIRRKPGFNPRFDFGEIEELAHSIKANGLLNPIRVKRCPASVLVAGKGGVYEIKEDPKGATFELIDGDRRLTAIEFLLKKGWSCPDGIPAIMVDRNQTDITSLVQMFEANTGKPFLPMEEAMAYKKMQEAGLTVHQICEKVSKAPVHVISILALLQADSSVQEAVKDGSLKVTQAKKIAVHARGDKAKQAKLVAQAKAAGKDKVKRAQLDKDIDDSRRAKAAKTGKVLKIRALTDAELSQIGAELAVAMAERMKDCGFPLDSDVRGWVAKDDKLALAFTFGALEALKVAAGMINNLVI